MEVRLPKVEIRPLGQALGHKKTGRMNLPVERFLWIELFLRGGLFAFSGCFLASRSVGKKLSS